MRKKKSFARFPAALVDRGELRGIYALVSLVLTLERVPESVLDAGCGTGRVVIGYGRGLFVVGVDVDESMLAAGTRAVPEIEWIHHDLASLDLGRTFDAVVMAGNVPLFTAPGTHAALVAGCARHVRAGGRLVAGFQTDRGFALADTTRTARRPASCSPSASAPGTARRSSPGRLRGLGAHPPVAVRIGDRGNGLASRPVTIYRNRS